MQGQENLPKKLWLAMVLMALAISFSFQGSRGLYETTEGRYAESAREMIERGNYLEPTLGYRPHWTKPPLTYWAIAGGIKLLGPNEWGIRLYNAIAFFFTILAVASIGTLLWGKIAGLSAGLIYASSPFPVSGAYAVSTDTLLTLWEICAVLCFLKARRAQVSGKGGRWVVAMWIFFGLGFLTKGPPALIPLIPILVWHFYRKGPLRLAHPLGIALFILIGFSWYIIVSLRHPQLLSYFLGQEVLGRVTSHVVHNYQWYKPFTLYLPALILGAGPWLYFGFKTLWRRRLFHPAVLWSHFRRGNDGSFLLLWLFLPLILFFLVKSRLRLYVLPLYAPIALAIARGTCESGGKIIPARKVFSVALITAFVLLGLKGLSSVYPNKNDMKSLYALCRKVGGEDKEFVAFNQPKLYGLQYYLKGHLERVSNTGKETWSEGSIEDLVKGREGTISLAPYALISDKNQAPALGRLLKNSGLRFQQIADRYWVAFW